LTASIARGLILRLAEGEARLQLLQPGLIEVVGNSLHPLALGVEREQLAGQLVHIDPRPRLEQLPGLAAELGESGRLAVGADVARDLADLLVRNVEAIVALEGQQQVVARNAGDLLGLEGLQLADALVFVHHVVARAQVGEGLQRAPDPRRLPGRPLAEDLARRQENETELAPDQPAPSR